MDAHLKIQLGQQELTPEQEAEARRFADERIAAQLLAGPVNEPEAEEWLRAAYQVAGLAPPGQIIWLDGPLPFIALLLSQSVWDCVREQAETWGRALGWAYFGAHVKPCVQDGAWESVWGEVKSKVAHRVWELLGKPYEWSDRVGNSVWDHVRMRAHRGVWDSVGQQVYWRVRSSTWSSIKEHIRAIVEPLVGSADLDSVLKTLLDPDSTRHSLLEFLQDFSAAASVRAYFKASDLAEYHFSHAYLSPNELHALICFNTQVSGYWLETDRALLVRRPQVLARDAVGRLHHPSGKCVEYLDGWGFYAWHGVPVPERIILAPEALTREDFLKEWNLEVRRVIQEQMGDRFVLELGGEAIDTGSRGTLYEVRLPNDDPERVARYVQVQDASTSRQYFLRVPPTVQTAAEAVAWSFQLAAEQYRPG